jgi:hypothetical protein
MPEKPCRASSGSSRSVAPRLILQVIVVCVGLPIGAFSQESPSQREAPAGEPKRREASVEAPVLQWIQIDGDLADWPAAMPRHAISKRLAIGQLGTGGLDDADTATSPDLSASFMVGYDPKKQVLYLAVIVRDDELVVGNTSHLDTDAVEVYVDGLRTERSIPLPGIPNWWDSIELSEVPVQQYVAIPGPGKVYGTRYETNPVLMAGDLSMTRTRMAYRRKRDVTTYEWAIQVFDRYPDRPTRLEPGKRIGFDVAVADKDVPVPPHSRVLPRTLRGLDEPAEDRAAWIYWGPEWTNMKVLDAGLLGEVVLKK